MANLEIKTLSMGEALYHVSAPEVEEKIAELYAEGGIAFRWADDRLTNIDDVIAMDAIYEVYKKAADAAEHLNLLMERVAMLEAQVAVLLEKSLDQDS